MSCFITLQEQKSTSKKRWQFVVYICMTMTILITPQLIATWNQAGISYWKLVVFAILVLMLFAYSLYQFVETKENK